MHKYLNFCFQLNILFSFNFFYHRKYFNNSDSCWEKYFTFEYYVLFIWVVFIWIILYSVHEQTHMCHIKNWMRYVKIWKILVIKNGERIKWNMGYDCWYIFLFSFNFNLFWMFFLWANLKEFNNHQNMNNRKYMIFPLLLNCILNRHLQVYKNTKLIFSTIKILYQTCTMHISRFRRLQSTNQHNAHDIKTQFMKKLIKNNKLMWIQHAI